MKHESGSLNPNDVTNLYETLSFDHRPINCTGQRPNLFILDELLLAIYLLSYTYESALVYFSCLLPSTLALYFFSKKKKRE